MGFCQFPNWLFTASMTVSTNPKLTVLEAEAASEFPDTLNGIEFGAIRREEVKRESRPLLFSPGPVPRHA